jgi:hypothetical protein
VSLRNTLFVLVGSLVLAINVGCGGSLSPLYADFRIDERPAPVELDSTTTASPDSLQASTIQDAIADALREVGWELDEPPSENAVSTAEVGIIDWGLYEVRVSLDVVPINQRFVRVYVHPYREYFFGSRSKMSYLNRRVRTYVFPELSQALRARGIVPVGEPQAGNAQQEGQAKPEDSTQEASTASTHLDESGY